MTRTEPPEGAPAGARGPAEGAGTLALTAGILAVLSAWTGWGGLVLGLVAVVAGVVAAARVRAGRAHRRARPRIGLGLGLLAVIVGVVVEWTTLSGAVTYLHSSQPRTLDECMRQAQNEKEQHVCKTQHLGEYRARYPGRLDP